MFTQATVGNRTSSRPSRIVLSVLLAALLLLSTGAPAAADFGAPAIAQAAQRLQALGIVKGMLRSDGTVDLALHSNITRAHLATILVRAFGGEADAKLLQGAAAFSDTATHWASGYIAYAKRIAAQQGVTLGRTPTTFDPDANVSAAEALALGMKLLGLKPKVGLAWPMNYLQGAVDAGVISAADQAQLAAATGPAERGTVFVIIDSLFSKYAGGEQTLYTLHHTATLTLNSYPAATDADAVTLTGTVTGAKALTVAGAPATFDAAGSFTATVPLSLGANSVEFAALDMAGTIRQTATITRNPGAPAQLEAYLGTPNLPAGTATPLTVIIKDKYGNRLSGAAYTVDAGTLVTVDQAAGTVTAGKTTGSTKVAVASGALSATLPLTVVAGPLAAIDPATALVPAGKSVQLVAKDQYGNPIASGVTWTVSATGAVVTATGTVVTATGLFSATSDGAYTITAAAGGKTATAKVTVDSVKPTLERIYGQNVLVGSSVWLTPRARSHTGGPLTFKADGLPPGLSLDPATGIITGTLPLKPGNTLVTLTVTDAAGNSASQSFSWSWYLENDPGLGL